MIDCSLLEASNRISNDHMKAMAIQERDRNFSKFRQHITTPTVSMNMHETDEQLRREYSILQGLRVDKNTCIYKKPEYNRGYWEKQNGTFVNVLGGTDVKLFDIQTKRR